MEKSSKISDIKNRLSQMGLVDRFFYLVHELYENYFVHLKRYSKNESDFFHKEVDGQWEIIPEESEQRKNFGVDSLKYRFLQEFGNRELSIFILSEIQQLTSIFWQKYSFEFSYLFNPNNTRDFYLSNDTDFLLLAPFMYDEKSFKAAIVHELAISDIEERGFLLNKYQGVLSEIKYRINSNFVWDASLEDGRDQELYGIVFPARKVVDLNNYSSFLIELSENPQEFKSYIPFVKETEKAEERLVLKGVRPETMVKTFAKVLNRAGDESQIRNFVASIFRYNFRKDFFGHELTDDFLKLKNKDETFRICETIILMKSLEFIQIQNATPNQRNSFLPDDSFVQNDSFIMRVVVGSLKKKNQTKNVWLSDNFRKILRECHLMTQNQLSQSIGFSSVRDLKQFLSSNE